MNRKKRSQRGFTLLEILVAMAVFAIMAAMAYAGLAAVLDAREGTERRSENLAQLQQTLYVLNEDLAQAVRRPVRDEFGANQPAFKGGIDGELLTLTRRMPDWSPVSPTSQLQRISYRFEDGILYRQVWTVLDRTQQSQSRRRKLMNLESAEVRFRGEDWGASWPMGGGGLPKAVEVKLTLANLGEIRRMFWVQE